MNQLGNSLVLQDLAGNITNGGQGQCLGVCIKSALTGTLTITGISNPDGTPASWVIPSTTVGYVPCPAGSSAKYWSGGMNYTLSNVADAAKAIAMWVPQ